MRRIFLAGLLGVMCTVAISARAEGTPSAQPPSTGEARSANPFTKPDGKKKKQRYGGLSIIQTPAPPKGGVQAGAQPIPAGAPPGWTPPSGVAIPPGGGPVAANGAGGTYTGSTSGGGGPQIKLSSKTNGGAGDAAPISVQVNGGGPAMGVGPAPGTRILDPYLQKKFGK